VNDALALLDMEVSPGVIGASLPRKEDGPLLTGRARFADDLARPGAVHACIVRSGLAHARVASISVEEALAVPGVVGVLTSEHLPDVRIPMRLYSLEGMERFLDGERAQDQDAPILHEETGTNLAASFTVERGDVDALFESAHLVVEERIESHRHAAVPLETRGLVAEWYEDAGELTVWGAAKVVHVNRRILAGMLGLRVERVRLIELHVGGGFGARGEVYPEDLLIPFCAMRFGRPVAWTEDRSEHLYDSGDFALLVDKAADRFGYDDLRRWRDEDPGDPALRRGVGSAMFVEKSGIGRWDYARVQLESGGKTVVYAGAASVGQGVETVLAQICAEHLGVGFDDLRVVHGDTATVPDGMGAFGSRTSALTGSAVMKASVALRARLLELAADALEIAPEDLTLEGDRVCAKGSPGRAITLGELAETARPERSLARGLDPRLGEETYFYAEDMSFPYGLHLAAVEVDVETGAVRVARYAVAYDIGRAINPQLVHGQIVGGAAQGIGGALLEELAYDESGQLVSGSFMDYLIPTACELPSVEVLVTEDAPTPLNPLGVKGSGEAGTAAAGAALANAVSDALGAEVTRLPLTAERVLELAAKGDRT
jgi:CO/xanthine dehydrogenase Mo-binding subunit